MESDEAMVINHLRGSDFSWSIKTNLSNTLEIAKYIGSVEWVIIPKNANLCANWLVKQTIGDCATWIWSLDPKPLFLV